MTERFDQMLILAYLEGELSEEEARRFEQRMNDDAQLGELVRGMAADREGLRNLPRPKAPDSVMDAVNQQLERAMLLEEPPSAEPAAHHLRWRLRNIAAGAAVAALLAVTALLVFAPLFDSPSAQPAASDQPGPELALNGDDAQKENIRDDAKPERNKEDAPASEPERRSNTAVKPVPPRAPEEPLSPTPEMQGSSPVTMALPEADRSQARNRSMAQDEGAPSTAPEVDDKHGPLASNGKFGAPPPLIETVEPADRLTLTAEDPVAMRLSVLAWADDNGVAGASPGATDRTLHGRSLDARVNGPGSRGRGDAPSPNAISAGAGTPVQTEDEAEGERLVLMLTRAQQTELVEHLRAAGALLAPVEPAGGRQAVPDLDGDGDVGRAMIETLQDVRSPDGAGADQTSLLEPWPGAWPSGRIEAVEPRPERGEVAATPVRRVPLWSDGPWTLDGAGLQRGEQTEPFISAGAELLKLWEHDPALMLHPGRRTAMRYRAGDSEEPRLVEVVIRPWPDADVRPAPSAQQPTPTAPPEPPPGSE